MAKKNILLIEPGYKNKYPPLGLMKIAQYHGPRGKGDRVKFIKGEDSSVLDTCWDRIYVTTLFSFEWKKISQAIDFAVEAAGGNRNQYFRWWNRRVTYARTIRAGRSMARNSFYQWLTPRAAGGLASP